MRLAGSDAARRKQRLRELAELRESGLTLQQIGDEYGLTRERVRQLLLDAGVQPRDRSTTVAIRCQLSLLGREEIAVRRFKEVADERIVATELDVPVAAVRQVLEERFPEYRLYRRSARFARPRSRHADDELVACLRTAGRRLPTPLRAGDYARFARGRLFPDGRPWPGPQTVAARFGRWTVALRAAGVRANPAAGPPPRISAADCMDAVAQLGRELGRAPSATEYERWSREADDRPSLSTVRSRLGSWFAVLQSSL